MPVSKNHRNIQSGCLVHEFLFTDIFNDINHSYRAAILKKKILWLLPFHTVWQLRTAIASNFLNKVLRSAIMKRSRLKNKANKTCKAVVILNYIKQRTLVVKINNDNERRENILIN